MKVTLSQQEIANAVAAHLLSLGYSEAWLRKCRAQFEADWTRPNNDFISLSFEEKQ